uniref:Uncharacterized protein n=1 Tax=Anguilla anguilla TaxID=7936 RepID=A0A0E9T367_ANGAN
MQETSEQSTVHFCCPTMEGLYKKGDNSYMDNQCGCKYPQITADSLHYYP